MWRRTARPILFLHLALSVILGIAAQSKTAAADGGTARPRMAGDADTLDRVSFAVEGAESSYGADPGMWGAAHVIKLDNTTQKRKSLITRLQTAGCSVNMAGDDWMSEGNFSS